MTAYQPDEGLVARIDAALAQVGCVVVVDDGSPTRVDVGPVAPAVANRVVVVRRHESNKGQAAALNTGVAVARELGYRWILTLDDDTTIYSGMVHRLLEAWDQIGQGPGGPVAVIGMEYSVTDLPDGAVSGGPISWTDKRGVITSGSLLSSEILDELGTFREEFFIDSVDYDFCLRARAAGYRVIQLRQAGMTHRLGRESRHRLGPLRFKTTNHGAERRYFTVRNSVVLALEHGGSDPVYAAAVLWHHAKSAVLVALWESNRAAKLRAMLRGARDGLRGHLGPIRAPLRR